LPSSGWLPGALVWRLLRQISRLPEREITTPPRISRLDRSPQSTNEARPIHRRLLVTSAVLLATEVHSSEVIQVAKCRARKKAGAAGEQGSICVSGC
jgi:hypothetical protein